MQTDKIAKIYADVSNMLLGRHIIDDLLSKKRELILRELRDVIVTDFGKPLAKNLEVKLLPITVTGEMVLKIIEGRLQ